MSTTEKEANGAPSPSGPVESTANESQVSFNK